MQACMTKMKTEMWGERRWMKTQIRGESWWTTLTILIFCIPVSQTSHVEEVLQMKLLNTILIVMHINIIRLFLHEFNRIPGSNKHQYFRMKITSFQHFLPLNINSCLCWLPPLSYSRNSYVLNCENFPTAQNIDPLQ